LNLKTKDLDIKNLKTKDFRDSVPPIRILDMVVDRQFSS
jgi:hypothetical protein